MDAAKHKILNWYMVSGCRVPVATALSLCSRGQYASGPSGFQLFDRVSGVGWFTANVGFFCLIKAMRAHKAFFVFCCRCKPLTSQPQILNPKP